MKLLRLVILSLVLLVCASAPAQPAAGKTPPYRFLVLVDSSYSMRRLDEITPTLVYDLITDGLYGRMQPGDVYAVWSFDEEVDTAFSPPLVWRPELARSQAQAIDEQIRRLKYKGKAKLEAAIAKIKPIASQSDDLTIFILHDGSSVMYGTPFDLEVTAIYKQFYKDMAKNERPFITGLAVQNKKMVAWSVDAAGGAPTIPYFPRKPRPGDPAPTNTVAKAVKPKEAPVPTPEPPPKKVVPSIIVKGPLKPEPKPTNAPVITATKPLAPKPVARPAPIVQPKATPVAAPEPKPELTQSTPPKMATLNEPASTASLPTPTTSAPAAIPSTIPAATITEPAFNITPSQPEEIVKASDIVPLPKEPVAAPVENSQAKAPVPVAVAATKAVDSAAQLAQTAVVVPPAGGPDWVKLSLGILCFVAAIIAVFFLGRRKQAAAHGSMISRSMNQDK
jgi:hypothetical protein